MKATLSFIPDLPIFQHEKPYELWLPAEEIPESLPWTNCQFFEHLATEIKVARSSNTDFGYETTRFKHLSSPLSQCFTGDSNWRYNNSMAQKYIKETVKLIERVLCTEGPVLRLERQYEDYQSRDLSRTQALGPAQNVHTDDTPWGGRMRPKRHPTDAELKDFEDGLTRIRTVK